MAIAGAEKCMDVGDEFLLTEDGRLFVLGIDIGDVSNFEGGDDWPKMNS